MSRFVDTLLAAAEDNAAAREGEHARGLTTGEPNQPVRRTWAEVHAQARRVVGVLGGEGTVRPGDAVAILAADPGSIAPTVQGIWLAGGSVTMLHQPTARTDLAQWAQDTVRTLRMVGARLVLLGPPFEQLTEIFAQHSISYREMSEFAALKADTELWPDPVVVAEDATALLQLTSGSTAEPKAVRITHGNLYSNMRAMVTAAELDPAQDVLVSWLPLFHDMGMVGCLTVPMAVGIETVKVTPADFLARPSLWLELISRYGATVTAAPNFAYAVVGRRLSQADEGAFDLSTLRFALNGAEPIDPEAVRKFTDAGARFGLRAECVVPAFGMAESTLAVSFGPLNRGVEVDVVDAEELERHRRAVPATENTWHTRRFTLLGRPLPELSVGVIDDRGRELGEREVGQLRIRGGAVTPGYLTMEGPIPGQDEEGWLNTGDEGYLVDGQVVICGRRKDVIIMGGRNVYPVDIERAACEVDEVRAGNAAAVRLDSASKRERFAVVLESRIAGDEDAEKNLRKRVTARIVDAIGLRPSTVVVLKPGSLPKTPSGKLKRAATADLLPEE